MSKQIEVYVDDLEGNEKIILVKDYHINCGYPAKVSGPPEDCYPAESTYIEDIDMAWQETGTKLTDEEVDRYIDQVEEAIYEANESEGDYDD
jgi:hypothetical protein